MSNEYHLNEKQEFFINLISTDGDLRTQSNTLSDFTNFLPRPLNLSSGRWVVGLHAIYIHNEVQEPQNDEIHYIKVFCDEIATSGTQERCLAVFARQKDKRAHYHPQFREYFMLNSFILDKLRIYIQGGNKAAGTTKLLKLYAGQPTVVTLHFKRMMSFPTRIIRVQSKDPISKDIFPDNKANSFTAKLGQAFKFEPWRGGWEMALSTITYMPSLKPKIGIPFSVELLDRQKKDLTSVSCSEVFVLSNDHNKYITYLNNILRTVADKAEILVDSSKDSPTKLTLESSVGVYLSLPFALFYNMGMRNFKREEDGGKFFIRKDEKGRVHYFIKLKANDPVTMDVDLDALAYNPEVGVVYCDCVNPSIVGEQEAPILKAFPLKRAEKECLNKYVSYESPIPEFYPLNRYDLSMISFSIRDVSGEMLPFLHEDANVMLTLMPRFRPNVRMT